jgi:hypothetical protein
MSRNGFFGEFSESPRSRRRHVKPYSQVGRKKWAQEHEQGETNGPRDDQMPRNGSRHPDGMVADRESFNATPVFFARVHCPICRTEHEWFAKEAWVCEPAPRERPRAAA